MGKADWPPPADPMSNSLLTGHQKFVQSQTPGPARDQISRLIQRRCPTLYLWARSWLTWRNFCLFQPTPSVFSMGESPSPTTAPWPNRESQRRNSIDGNRQTFWRGRYRDGGRYLPPGVHGSIPPQTSSDPFRRNTMFYSCVDRPATHEQPSHPGPGDSQYVDDGSQPNKGPGDWGNHGSPKWKG